MLFSIIFTLIAAVVEAEVEMVQVLFRHGDRAASGRYPNDPHFEKDFSRGYSQLTDIGFSQANELGEFLRYRYTMHYDTIKEKYDRKQVYVRSSDKDRCIETAMGVVSTLFPNQIVPVHTYSTHKDDMLLKPNSIKCEKSKRLVKSDKARLFAKRNREYSELFKYLTRHTGMEVSMENVKDIYNAVYREYSNGLPQPSWVFNTVYPHRNRTVFEDILELKREERMETFNSFEKSRLTTGYLLGQMAENIEERIAGKSLKRMNLYASHDATLTSLMYNLGVSNDLLPPYASALLLELHSVKGQYYVKLLYRNSTTSDPYVLSMPGCLSSLCTLSEFRTFVKERSFATRPDAEAACKMTEAPEVHMTSSLPKSDAVKNIEESIWNLDAVLSLLDGVLHPHTVLHSVLLVQICVALQLYYSSIKREYVH